MSTPENGAAGFYRVLEVEGREEELELATAIVHEQECLGTELTSPSTMNAYFEAGVELPAVIEQLSAALPGISCAVLPTVEDRDWLALWKEGLEGFEVGSRYFVLPTWREPSRTSRTVLRIDPERAFGTGTHETTALMVDLLETHVFRGARVLDIGTGTGILAMVAVLEGAASVLAIDSDPDACACAIRNVARSDTGHAIEVAHERLESLERVNFDIVVANINASVLGEALPRLYGTLLLSGILAQELSELEAGLPAGATVADRRFAGEWAALVVERPRNV